jgi:hypothetical protein
VGTGGFGGLDAALHRGLGPIDIEDLSAQRVAKEAKWTAEPHALVQGTGSVVVA